MAEHGEHGTGIKNELGKKMRCSCCRSYIQDTPLKQKFVIFIMQKHFRHCYKEDKKNARNINHTLIIKQLFGRGQKGVLGSATANFMSENNIVYLYARSTKSDKLPQLSQCQVGLKTTSLKNLKESWYVWFGRSEIPTAL